MAVESLVINNKILDNYQTLTQLSNIFKYPLTH